MDREQLDELRELIGFLKANEISEFDMERSDLKVRLKFLGAHAPVFSHEDANYSGRFAVPSAMPPLTVSPSVGSGSASAASPTPATSEDEGSHTVKSPIVGTFYESPAPGAPPFVKIGDQVEAGQVLCIVEAMKLMNEIESDVAGEVIKRIASSGQPVEYGQPLFLVRPR